MVIRSLRRKLVLLQMQAGPLAKHPCRSQDVETISDDEPEECDPQYLAVRQQGAMLDVFLQGGASSDGAAVSFGTLPAQLCGLCRGWRGKEKVSRGDTDAIQEDEVAIASTCTPMRAVEDYKKGQLLVEECGACCEGCECPAAGRI